MRTKLKQKVYNSDYYNKKNTIKGEKSKDSQKKESIGIPTEENNLTKRKEDATLTGSILQS